MAYLNGDATSFEKWSVVRSDMTSAKEALRYFQMAAAKGHGGGKIMVATASYYGWLGPQDLKTAETPLTDVKVKGRGSDYFNDEEELYSIITTKKSHYITSYDFKVYQGDLRAAVAHKIETAAEAERRSKWLAGLNAYRSKASAAAGASPPSVYDIQKLYFDRTIRYTPAQDSGDGHILVLGVSKLGIFIRYDVEVKDVSSAPLVSGAYNCNFLIANDMIDDQGNALNLALNQ